MTFDEKTRKLTPSEGMYLTQVELQDESQRAFSLFCYIAVGGKIDVFCECTEAEKLAWEEEHMPKELIEVEQ